MGDRRGGEGKGEKEVGKGKEEDNWRNGNRRERRSVHGAQLHFLDPPAFDITTRTYL